ncbi:hypothetical protein [Cellulomonas hominis]
MARGELFERVDVSSWTVVDAETGGADEKLWLAGPDARWLFKPVTITSTGHRQGEDWAEKAAAHLAEMLGVPCAEVELAARHGVEGALSRDLCPPGYQLQSGSLLLLDRSAPRFVPARELLDDKTMLARRPGHSLENIRDAMRGVLAPPGPPLPPELDAFDTFVGYLILDAWIGNRDRHDENWSVLVPETGDGPLRLCGSYDQAGGLGFNLTDRYRETKMVQRQGHDVLAFARRGTAWRFENYTGRPTRTLVQLAIDGLELASAPAQRYWAEQIDLITDADPGGDLLPARRNVSTRAYVRVQTAGHQLREDPR